MQIKVSGRHIDVTEAIRAYAAEKAGKLPRYFDRVQAIDVILDKGPKNGDLHVEMIVDAEHADPFVANASGADLYACIDDAVNKLERQLTDHKDRLRNRKHNV
jgi:putative sigma-54 modulation protein